MNPYNYLMSAAVEAKRFLKGTKGQRKYTQYLESIEYKSRDEIHHLQAIEMSVLLNHAVENIPFYKQFRGSLELSPETAHRDIKEFPILTKKLIKENAGDLVMPFGTGGKWFKGGGSSGNATSVLRDKNEITCSIDEYCNRLAGYYPGDSRLIISRPESVYFVQNAHDVPYSGNLISRTYKISPAYMDNERLEIASSIYRRKKPKVISGITEPIYRFAEYVLENNIPTHEMTAIVTGGQTMLPKHRQVIERAFKTKRVFDMYGASEIGLLGSQCSKFAGYHYVPVVHYVEVLDNDLQESGMGTAGNFIITNLQKREMPLIRYQIEDMAVMSDEACSCGRGFPIIKRFEGRQIESIVSPKQTYMTPLPFYDIMDKFKNVDDFLVEQRAENTVTVMLKIKSGEFTQIQQLVLRKEINRYLDYPMKLNVEYIDEVKALPNGKVLRIKGLESFINKDKSNV